MRWNFLIFSYILYFSNTNFSNNIDLYNHLKFQLTKMTISEIFFMQFKSLSALFDLCLDIFKAMDQPVQLTKSIKAVSWFPRRFFQDNEFFLAETLGNNKEHFSEWLQDSIGSEKKKFLFYRH